MTMADDMWLLIPAVYRRRDADAGNVLKALIEVFGEQAGLIHDDISELYDNWFIETCDDWVVPYIGDLTGALPLVPTGDPPTQAEAAKMAQVAPPRLMVANAIRLRRRKGCFSIIAQLAHDVALWRMRSNSASGSRSIRMSATRSCVGSPPPCATPGCWRAWTRRTIRSREAWTCEMPRRVASPAAMVRRISACSCSRR